MIAICILLWLLTGLIVEFIMCKIHRTLLNRVEAIVAMLLGPLMIPISLLANAAIRWNRKYSQLNKDTDDTIHI